MKRIIIAFAALIAFSACNNEANQTENTPAATDSAAVVQAPAVDPNAEIDPVCNMVKDNTWTDYAVEGSDTTWFCSSTCKDAYVANPAKYKKG